LVAKMHQNAPKYTLNFKNYPRIIHVDPVHWEEKGEKGKEEVKGKGKGKGQVSK